MEQAEPSKPSPAGEGPEKNAASAPAPAGTAPSGPQQPSTPSDGGEFRAALKSLLRSAAAGTWAMLRYYNSHRGDLWRYFVEIAPFLEATGDRQREIRVSKDDAIGAEAFDGNSWRLTLPDCCVVTGQPGKGEWIDETRQLPDMAWPFWSAVAGLFGGLLISLLFGRFWLWPLAILGGLATGYAKRQTRQVVLRFRRSVDVESADNVFPLVRVFPGALLILFGSPNAKKAFVQERVARQAAQSGRPGATMWSHAATPRSSLNSDEPRPIPLDPPTPGPVAGRHAPPKPRDELPPISLDDPG